MNQKHLYKVSVSENYQFWQIMEVHPSLRKETSEEAMGHGHGEARK